MQREVIKWLQTLDLATPVKNPRHDLANGAAAAEIVSRYADSGVLSMHGISTGASMASRRDNWAQVLKALGKLGCDTVSADLVDAVMRLQANAAQTVLENLYEFFTRRTLAMRTVDEVGVLADGGRRRVENARFITPAQAEALAGVLETTGEVAAGTFKAASTKGRSKGRDAAAMAGFVDDDDGGESDVDEEELARRRREDTLRAQRALALTQNEELAGGVDPALRQPNYARPTAAALMHAANGVRQEVAIKGAKYATDEPTAVRRNLKIVQQHEELTRRARAEQKVAEDAKRRARAERAAEAAQRRGSSTPSILATLRGPYAPNTAAFKEKQARFGPNASATSPRGKGRHNNNNNNNRSGAAADGRDGGGAAGADGGRAAHSTNNINGNKNNANATPSASARKVQVNIMTDALKEALALNGNYLNSDYTTAKSIELFESYGYDLRLAISSLFKDILVAQGEYAQLLTAARLLPPGGDVASVDPNDNQLEDLLTLALTHRELLSTRCLRACWASLHQNMPGLVAALHRQPQGYAYLVNACSFAFALESAQLPFLHVTSHVDSGSGDDDGDGDSARTGSAEAKLEAEAQRRHFRSQSVGNVLIDSARRSTFQHVQQPGAGGAAAKHQQTIIHDRRAFDLASVFVFFSALGEALGGAHPDEAVEVLQLFFCPAVRRSLLPSGSPALVEAVARVVVQTVAPEAGRAPGEEEEEEPPSSSQADAKEGRPRGGGGGRRTASEQWRLEERLDMVLSQVLLPAALGGYDSAVAALQDASRRFAAGGAGTFAHTLAVTRPPNMTQLQFRYHLLLYHTLSKVNTAGSRWCLPAAAAPGDSPEKTTAEQQGPFGKPASALEVQPVYPLVQRCAEAAAACLASEHTDTQSLGFALLIRLITWECWAEVVAVVRGQTMSINDGGGRGDDSVADAATAASGASTGVAVPGPQGRGWETRVLMLEALTMLLQKVVLLLAEEHTASEAAALEQLIRDEEEGEEGQEQQDGAAASAGVNSNDTPAARRRRRVLAALPLPLLESLVVEALGSFRHSPHAHRRLALSIAGRRLLPDFEPRVARLWVAMLTEMPVDLFAQCLSPFEESPAEQTMPATGASGGEGSRGSGSAAGGAASAGWMQMRQPPNGRVSDSASAAARASLASPGGGSSIRMLTGRIEPAYVLAPLNQSWETFGVVQAALQDRRVPRYHVLSIVAAAFISPQPVDVQEAQVLHHAYVVLAAAGGSGNKGGGSPNAGRGEKGDNDEEEEEALRVTMRDLIATGGHQRRGAGGEEGGEADRWSDVLEADAESAPALVERFWKATLTRLMPALRTLLTPEEVAAASAGGGGASQQQQQQQQRQRRASYEAAAAEMTALDDERRLELQELAVALVLSMTQRYAGVEAESLTVKGLLDAAEAWSASPDSIA